MSTLVASTERLFTTRPRSLLSPTVDGDRGYRGYIRLMTSQTVDVTDTSVYATSIAGTGGVLDQAVNGGTYGGYASFLITGLQCMMSEKLQITETFGDGEVYYYFGREPVTINVSGILIDSVDNDWFTQWLYMYGQVLRGTQVAKRYQLVKLVMPNMTLIGTISSMSFTQEAGRDTDIPFQFQFMAKHVIPTPIVSSGISLAQSSSLINFTQANSFLSQSGINSLRTSLAGFVSDISGPLATINSVAAGVMGIANAAANELDGVSNAFYSVTATLAGLRASLFSPAYGVLSSLTKLIASAGGVVNAYNSSVAQVNNILRDIDNISADAVGLVSLVNSDIFNGGAALLTSNSTTLTAIGSLTNTQGVISTAPDAISVHTKLRISW
jgi:hypothetical protein